MQHNETFIRMVRIPDSDHFVVKLGGSLMEHAPRLIDILVRSGRNITIVPGGGCFADSVREMELDDDSSHWMAILAMEQYGCYLHSLGLAVQDELVRGTGVCVLLPYSCLREDDPLPHSWDVTSDTIAAWAAGRMGSPLILLKSTEGLSAGGRTLDIVSSPGSYPECDPCLVPYVLENGIHTTVINANDGITAERFFRGEEVAGTVIIRSV
ncbi:aspartate/glutamate/uridylate kinase [Methanolacinia petrolearia DSM 11571]|uniref:Aspartate/glutamate/uridylate kinase n=2 Tax=Methanolacinia TaxID=230355 RepID=E1REJ8_METP4|nr:aspartate/glutamate/uridylate kinase [Methanolacinia petrolearia]ADN34945.1 aspartate/glutamate/uridylate kinase [Methanolacinia petrolearia DSM 11571]